MSWWFSVKQSTYDKWYPFEKWNHFALFLDDVVNHQSPDHAMLDLGAGAGTSDVRSLKHHFARVCGVDVDPRVVHNPTLHEGKLIQPDGRIPYDDATFDFAIADYVFEHLDDPVPVLREAARVLKPGGRLYFRTLNRWHYLSIISRCMPRRFAAYLADTLGHQPADAGDTFQTHWHLNAPRQLNSCAQQAALELTDLATREMHPVYFQLFAPLWYIGVATERLMNRCPCFGKWRIQLTGHMTKPSAERDPPA